MNNASFQRKVTYLVLIAVLLVPLALVSRPATVGGSKSGGSDGGVLARLRHDYKLGQAQMGEIDPASGAMRYLSFGLQGIAICVLQEKEEEYRRQEDWLTLAAVLKQRTVLQPFYVKVWTHQAWNVAYNISSQWDDPHDKYYWVVYGFKLLAKGMGLNEDEPRFPHELGWTVGHKLGQSDEKQDFRKDFTKDEELHRLEWAARADRRDSWLFSKRYHEFAVEMVDVGGKPLRSMGTELFHLHAPLAQVQYAEAIEREGTFGNAARGAWQTALDDVRAFGDFTFPSQHGYLYRLNDFDADKKLLAERLDLLDNKLAPGARQALEVEKRTNLPAEWLEALQTTTNNRSEKQRRMALDAEYNMIVRDHEVAQRAPAEKRDEALRVADDVLMLRRKVSDIESSRHIWNYDYWLDRCRMESSDEALAARQYFFDAMKAADDDPWVARKAFEEAFRRWRVILDKYPVMVSDRTSYDVNEYIKAYVRTLKQLDQPFDPQNFILHDLLKHYQDQSMGG